MPPRGAAGGCRRRRLAPLNEDNGRFLLLAALIAAYLSAGATVFSALESPSEAAAQLRWNRTLHNFSRIFNISLPELRAFLRSYEAAMAAGIRVDALRPRWDFPGAFYFVGTVVSTIGERSPDGEARGRARGALRPRPGAAGTATRVWEPRCPGNRDPTGGIPPGSWGHPKILGGTPKSSEGLGSHPPRAYPGSFSAAPESRRVPGIPGTSLEHPPGISRASLG